HRLPTSFPCTTLFRSVDFEGFGGLGGRGGLHHPEQVSHVGYSRQSVVSRSGGDVNGSVIISIVSLFSLYFNHLSLDFVHFDQVLDRKSTRLNSSHVSI